MLKILDQRARQSALNAQRKDNKSRSCSSSAARNLLTNANPHTSTGGDLLWGRSCWSGEESISASDTWAAPSSSAATASTNCTTRFEQSFLFASSSPNAIRYLRESQQVCRVLPGALATTAPAAKLLIDAEATRNKDVTKSVSLGVVWLCEEAGALKHPGWFQGWAARLWKKKKKKKEDRREKTGLATRDEEIRMCARGALRS